MAEIEEKRCEHEWQYYGAGLGGWGTESDWQCKKCGKIVPWSMAHAYTRSNEKERGKSANATYELRTYLICSLYDESTVLAEMLFAQSDEDAARIAVEITERNGWRDNEYIRGVRVMKNGTEIERIK